MASAGGLNKLVMALVALFERLGGTIRLGIRSRALKMMG